MTETPAELPSRDSLALPPPIWLPPMNPGGARFLMSPARQPQEIHRAWRYSEVGFCGLRLLAALAPEMTREAWEANEVPLCDGCSAAAWAVQHSREKLDPPPMVIIRRTFEQPVVVCPHCLAPDTIDDHDRGDRYLAVEFYYTEDGDENEDGEKQILASPEKGERNFHTIEYACRRCDRAVSIPDDSVEFVYG